MAIWIPFSILSFLFLGVGITSAVHHYRVNNYLKQPIKISEDLKNRLKKHTEETVGVGVTVFDALYESYRLSPETLAGMEHLHQSKNFENFADLSDYISDKIVDGDLTRDVIHKYKGYTGEEQVFEKLEDLGYEVDVPESATNPGYDAIVDGQKIDVGITDDPAYIQDKLDSMDPDVMVYTNKEMAEAFGDHPDVIVDPNISVQEAFHLTEGTFEAISDPASYSEAVPMLTLAIATVRHGNKYRSGDIDGSIAIEHTVADTIGVGGGILVGGKIGTEIGAALAAPTGGASLVVAPILGSIAGAITGRVGSEYYKNRDLNQAIQSLKKASKIFYKKFAERFSILLLKLDLNFSGDLELLKKLPREKESLLKRLFFPSVFTKFCMKAKKRLNQDWDNTKNYYEELKDKLESEEPEQAGLILYAQGANILLQDQPLIEKFNNVDKKIEKVEKEKEKIGKKNEEQDIEDTFDEGECNWEGWYVYENSILSTNEKLRMILDIKVDTKENTIEGKGKDLEESKLPFEIDGTINSDNSVEFTKVYQNGPEIDYKGFFDDGVIEGEWIDDGFLGAKGNFKIWPKT